MIQSALIKSFFFNFELAEIYRQKLRQFVEDGELSEEEVASLQRYRVLLCIHHETIDAAHADICGRLFEKVKKSLCF